MNQSIKLYVVKEQKGKAEWATTLLFLFKMAQP